MSTSIKSRILGAAFALSVATPLSAAQAIITATPAQAVAFSSIMSAAKSVGGAVTSTAAGIRVAGYVKH